MVITNTKLHWTSPQLRFVLLYNLACDVSKVRVIEDFLQWVVPAWNKTIDICIPDIYLWLSVSFWLFLEIAKPTYNQINQKQLRLWLIFDVVLVWLLIRRSGDITRRLPIPALVTSVMMIYVSKLSTLFNITTGYLYYYIFIRFYL